MIRLLAVFTLSIALVGSLSSEARGQQGDIEPATTAPVATTTLLNDDLEAIVEWSPYAEPLPSSEGSSGEPGLISQDFELPALMTGLTWHGEAPHAIWIQSRVGGVWGAWELLTEEHSDHAHDDEAAPSEPGDDQDSGSADARPGTAIVLLAEPEAFRYLVEGPIEDARAFIFLDSEPEPAPGSFTRTAPTAGDLQAPAALTDGAAIVRDRTDWDTNDCRVRNAPFTYSTPEAIIVHHTAGSNDYSQSQVPALLRGLCSYSTGSLGLDDVGYNFVIDKFGTVWEGRTGSKTLPVRGAHALGFNSVTQGVVLFGNYDVADTTIDQEESLRLLLNWLTGWYGIDPVGQVDLVAQSDGPGFDLGDVRTVGGISGHREVGVTACPGGRFFPKLQTIASEVRPTDFGSDPATVPVVDRIAGVNRYDTAAQVSTRFAENPCVIVIASGENFPDGLASATFGAPILLTRADALPAETEARLAAAAADAGCAGGLEIVIVGGPSAVSAGVEEALELYGSVSRVAGPSRYETALGVAQGLADADPIEGVVLTTGRNFPDALAGGVLAQWEQDPILLNDGPALRTDIKAFLVDEGVAVVRILGGPTAVPQSVLDEIATLGITVDRLSGTNRSATATAIAGEMDAGGPTETVVLVNGFGFADALSAAPYAFDDASFPERMTPLLLAAPSSLPQATADYLVEFCSQIDRIVVIGGESAVSAAVVAQAVASATCAAS
jgi:putative cell wall-binding protein